MNETKMRPKLESPKTAGELLDLFFLDARSQILEAAAILDRIERAPGGGEAMNDPRLVKLRQAAELLIGGAGNRAERFLMLFSDPVD